MRQSGELAASPTGVEPSVAGLASAGAPLSEGAAPSVEPELEPLEPLDPLDADPLELEPPELDPPPPNSPPSPPSKPPSPPSPDDSPPPPLDEPPEDAPLAPEQALLWHVPPVGVQSAHDPPAVPQALSAVPGWHAPVESQQPDAQEAVHADMVPLEPGAGLLLVSAPASLPESSPRLAKSFSGPEPQAVPRTTASAARN